MREYTRGGEGDWRPETNAGVRKRRVPGSRLVRRSSRVADRPASIGSFGKLLENESVPPGGSRGASGDDMG